MENFEYYNPVKVYFGEGRLREIGQIASQYGKKAMIVTYENSAFFDETVNRIIALLKSYSVDCIEFRGVTANPLISQAKLGVELCRENSVDLLIALGGGSVMDCTKIIATGAVYQHQLAQMIKFSHNNNDDQIPPQASLPTIMIPTLPGTGSEMNPTAVITDDVTCKKSYVWAPSCMYAKATLMDPELTVSLPPYQTACGAFDIIAHAAEAYLNGNPAYDLTLQEYMQEGVIKSVLETMPRVHKNPADLQARGIMMWAASIALNGWLSSGTFGFTPMHQMGHVLGSRFNATHGATLACMMPAWMRYFTGRPDNNKYSMLAERIFGCGISRAADKYEKLMSDYGVQTRISQLGAKKEDIYLLTQSVVDVSFGPDGLLNGNPKMSADDIHKIFELSL